MCAGAIIQARIPRVVIGSMNSKAGCAGSVLNILQMPQFNHQAEVVRGVCDIIPKSSAKPGDLIFFQGTYDTSGASHVGIYVGNGMMIHCGNPISYASIESNYWQQHFYCFGRIRN